MDGMNRYKQHVRCFIAVAKRDAALSLLRVIIHRLDLCGHELLFVSAATLIFFFFFMCISLLHFIVLSRVTLDLTVLTPSYNP